MTITFFKIIGIFQYIFLGFQRLREIFPPISDRVLRNASICDQLNSSHLLLLRSRPCHHKQLPIRVLRL
jgi:hypothetical protein